MYNYVKRGLSLSLKRLMSNIQEGFLIMSVHKLESDLQLKISRLIRFFSFKRKLLGLFIVSLFLITSMAIGAPTTLRITIGTFAPYYSPTLVHLTTETAISWDNPTAALHSITHDGCKNGPRCAFDSGPLGPKGTFTLQNLSPGSYPYHCSYHPIMQGVLVVKDSEVASET